MSAARTIHAAPPARLGALYVFTSRGGRLLAILGYLVVAAIFLMPLFWMVSTSFKTLTETFATPIQWLPSALRFYNYSDAWHGEDFRRFALNSVFVSISVTVIHVTLASLAGFGLAKYRFVGRRLLLLLILGTIMLPTEVIMVPLYLVTKNFGWLNTYQGLIMPTVADGFGVFLMRQFMLGVPDSLLESARMDGASDLRIFFRVAMPLAWPAVATLTIFIWRETWDDFVWPFIAISDTAHKTVPLGIAGLQQDLVTNYPQLMAISVLATIPMALIFLVFQRAFIRGIALQGLKG